MPRFLVQRPPRNFCARFLHPLPSPPASALSRPLCSWLPSPGDRPFLLSALFVSGSMGAASPANGISSPCPLRVWSNLVPPLFRLFRAVGDFPSRVYPSHSFPSLSSSLHPGFPAQHPSFLLLFPVRCLSSPRTSSLLSLPPFPYSSILPCNEHSSLPTFYSPRPPRPRHTFPPPSPRFACFYLPGNVVCYAGIKSFFMRYFACISY